MQKNTLVVWLMAALALILAGCGAATPTPAPLEGAALDAVLAYSEPAADSLMTAYQQSDYDTFVRDFSPEMLAGMTSAAFTKLQEQLNTQVGAYQSRAFDRVVDFGEYVTVYYKAKFEKTDKVNIVLSFSKTEPHQITGLWFR